MATAGRSGHRYRQLRDWVLANFDTCCICGRPVDKTLSGRNPAAPSLEHRHPLSRGGSLLSKDNAGLAHYGCNSRKKNHLRPRGIDNPTSRNW